MGDAEFSLTRHFEQYFRGDLADTPALKERVARIRYHVYCQEFGFEPLDRCPNGLETDEFDDYSLHCVISHRPSGLPAACARLVPPPPSNPAGPMPFEKHCADSLDWSFIESLSLDRNTACEISRLAVDGLFRRRHGESKTRFGQVEHLMFSPEERRTLPYLAVSAYLAATALTALTGRTNVFAMMEPFLPRLLSLAGIHFRRAGADVDYHGLRAPYFISTWDALASMKPDLRELYARVHEALEQALPKSPGTRF
jgi:N-acyl amino acid synthase of PEP-CTERM/exosortase system